MYVACMHVHVQGLQDAIGVSVVHPTWQRTRPNIPEDEHCGWTFVSPEDAPFRSATGGQELVTSCVARYLVQQLGGNVVLGFYWCYSCMHDGALPKSLCSCMHAAGFGSFPPTACVPDTINGAKFVRDLYEMCNDTLGELLDTVVGVLNRLSCVVMPGSRG